MGKTKTEKQDDQTTNERRPGPTDLSFRPEHYLNRELSWLEFNARVLEEAQDPTTPLLERVKFLSIFSSNLDEFFMVRVAGLREQAFDVGVPQDMNADGLRAIEQLRLIRKQNQALVAAQYQCLNDEILPQLAQHGIRIVEPTDIRGNQRMEDYFHQMVFPVITPMAIDPSHPRPRYHNRALYVMARLRRRSGLGPKQLFAVVQIPQILPRLVSAPGTDEKDDCFVLLEDLIEAQLPELFGGFDVEKTATFRITRDSDIDLIEEESDDMLLSIEERLRLRRRTDAVRLEVSAGADTSLIDLIVRQEQILTANDPHGYSEVYRVDGPVDLTGLISLLKLSDRNELRDPPFVPQVPKGLRRPAEDLRSAIARRDVLLHHPFESFMPVVEFVQMAAQDPDVLAIKQTLYRTSGDSPIVQALMEAADNGKQVTAIVELKARFDEEANVSWARQMERSGVHVVYGFMDLKTHSKVSLVVRREGESVRRYVHLSTGNYNPTTALLYTDIGLFTADEDIAVDVSALFNLLTGYSQSHRWRKLTVAPKDLQQETVRLINEQARRATKNRPSRIFAKLNSVVDPGVIDALYKASQAGVPIDLVVRGICCLRPGVPGISDNIRVTSIVDRFLEHSRVMVFGPDDSAKVFVSSADWMPRNFYRRVELMFPIESTPLRRRVLTEIVPAYLADNVKARELQSDGSYVRVEVPDDETPFRCQEELLKIAARDASDLGDASEPIKHEGKRKSRHKH
jgi:polyphosphate kinase